MYNLHIVVVIGEDAIDACDEALFAIGDWGGSDNWYEAIGAISESNERSLYRSDGRWPEDFPTIDEANALFTSHIASILHGPDRDRDEFLRIARGMLNGNDARDCGGEIEWYQAKRYCEKVSQAICAFGKGDSFDVFHDEFFSGQFDEVGVTNLVDDEEGEMWAVIINMHS